MLTIGCHLSTKPGYLGMAKEIVSIKGNTFQYFTRNPRGGKARALDENDISSFKEYAKEHSVTKTMGYASYDIEPASSDPRKLDFAISTMKDDISRLEHIPGQFYLVRPGSSDDGDAKKAIGTFSKSVSLALEGSKATTLLIDTMPGEGNQIGCTFEQLAEMLDGIDDSRKAGICIDPSALWTAGYDIKHNLDGVLKELDRVIGLNKVMALHLNDSIEDLGSKADRHARIGEGKIGFDALASLVKDPRLKMKPFYIEEPKATLDVYESDISRFASAWNDADQPR